MRPQVITLVNMKNTVFCNVTQCTFIDRNHYCEGHTACIFTVKRKKERKKKVKLSRYRPGVALLFHDRGIKRG
jgi:hypothetical protein